MKVKILNFEERRMVEDLVLVAVNNGDCYPHHAFEAAEEAFRSHIEDLRRAWRIELRDEVVQRIEACWRAK